MQPRKRGAAHRMLIEPSLDDPCSPGSEAARRVERGTKAAGHLKRLAFTFSVHRLDLDARASQVSGRGSRARQTGSIFHGIRAVHATGRSAHRHQHG